MELSWVNLFPIVFFPFKIIVLGIGMYYAIKWHHDQDKKKREEEAAAKDASSGQPAAGDLPRNL